MDNKNQLSFVFGEDNLPVSKKKFKNGLEKLQEQLGVVKIANNCFCNDERIIFITRAKKEKVKVDVNALSQSLTNLRDKKISNSDVLSSAFNWLGLSKEEPLYKSGLKLAQQGDGMTNNAYHNNDHLRDVSVLTLNLLATKIMMDKKILIEGSGNGKIKDFLNQDEREMMAVTLIAAVSHDLEHDGLGNTRMQDNSKKYIPFYLEKIAADAAKKEMQMAGVAPHLISSMEAMIYTTDVAEGYKVLRDNKSSKDLNISPEIKEKMQDDTVIEMAKIIRDADLLGSAGLTPKFFDEQTKRLEQEIHGTIDAKGASGFLEKLVGKFYSQPGEVFEDSLQNLIKINQVRLDQEQFSSQSLNDTNITARKMVK